MSPADRLSEWLSEVDNLSLSATTIAAGAQAGCLRALCMLIRLRPGSLGGAGLSAAHEGEVMRNIAAGAFETAALQLIPEGAKVITSTPGGGRFLASIRLRGQPFESTSSGRTFALAVVSALALSIVDRQHDLERSPNR